jgi:hypothetical protein
MNIATIETGRDELLKRQTEITTELSNAKSKLAKSREDYLTSDCTLADLTADQTAVTTLESAVATIAQRIETKNRELAAAQTAAERAIKVAEVERMAAELKSDEDRYIERMEAALKAFNEAVDDCAVSSLIMLRKQINLMGRVGRLGTTDDVSYIARDLGRREYVAPFQRINQLNSYGSYGNYFSGAVSFANRFADQKTPDYAARLEQEQQEKAVQEARDQDVVDRIAQRDKELREAQSQAQNRVHNVRRPV